MNDPRNNKFVLYLYQFLNYIRLHLDLILALKLILVS